ncbi:hypothetical protein ABGB12_34720 [Actinocorallia sp. B10E7]
MAVPRGGTQSACRERLRDMTVEREDICRAVLAPAALERRSVLVS